MKNQINIANNSTINIINQLLKLKDAKFEGKTLYKKTAKNFKKATGIEISNAPMIFVANECIWKLSHYTYKFKGRTYEKAQYLPIVGCKSYFKKLERTDIKF